MKRGVGLGLDFADYFRDVCCCCFGLEGDGASYAVSLGLFSHQWAVEQEQNQETWYGRLTCNKKK